VYNKFKKKELQEDKKAQKTIQMAGLGKKKYE